LSVLFPPISGASNADMVTLTLPRAGSGTFFAAPSRLGTSPYGQAEGDRAGSGKLNDLDGSTHVKSGSQRKSSCASPNGRNSSGPMMAGHEEYGGDSNSNSWEEGRRKSLSKYKVMFYLPSTLLTDDSALVVFFVKDNTTFYNTTPEYIYIYIHIYILYPYIPPPYAARGDVGCSTAMA